MNLKTMEMSEKSKIWSFEKDSWNKQNTGKSPKLRKNTNTYNVQRGDLTTEDKREYILVMNKHL